MTEKTEGYADAVEQGKIREISFTEAPASINFKFEYRGANVMLTMRGMSGMEVLDKLDAAMKKLEKMGAIFLVHTSQPNNGNGDSASAIATGPAPMCPTHGAAMKESKHKAGTWYCPKQIAPDDGTGNPVYCKQKA